MASFKIAQFLLTAIPRIKQKQGKSENLKASTIIKVLSADEDFTFSPYPHNISKEMKTRIYALTVQYPDDSLCKFNSIHDVSELMGIRLQHIRTRAVYYEMKVGDVSSASWTRRKGETYYFSFTRVR